jgi:hypothetical protein
LAAVGQSSRDAMVGVLGALVGAAVYAEAFPSIHRMLVPLGNLGEVTLADISPVSPWVFIVVLAILTVGLFVCLEQRAAKLVVG